MDRGVWSGAISGKRNANWREPRIAHKTAHRFRFARNAFFQNDESTHSARAHLAGVQLI